MLNASQPLHIKYLMHLIERRRRRRMKAARGRSSTDSCIFINSLEATEKNLLISQFLTPTHNTPIIRSIIQLSEALNALTFQMGKEYNFMKFAIPPFDY
jgi:hypothetical protein